MKARTSKISAYGAEEEHKAMKKKNSPG